MFSVGDLVFYCDAHPVPSRRCCKEKGVGIVVLVCEEYGQPPLYEIRWQKPEHFRHRKYCYKHQLVKATKDV